NASTGVVRWRSSLASTPSAGPVAFSTPALGDGVLVPTASGDAVFLTPNGSVRSTVHVSNAPVLIPATGSNLAVLAGEDGSVAGIALTVDPPVVEWVAPLLSAPSGTPALLESVAVAAADRGGRVYELASDGSLLFRMRVCDAVAGSPEMWSPKQALGKFIWIGCEDGSVLAIQANL
ncbi:MAG TPA: hypothetical protein VEM95_06870, partial [Thermoplasmata archaeon]|nr:hypothetical protein [Thermoplasmata archaeon]